MRLPTHRRRSPLARRSLMLCLCLLVAFATAAAAQTRVLILTGLAGEAGYGERFAEEAAAFAEALSLDGATVTRLEEDGATREGLKAWLSEAHRTLSAADQLIFVYVGHGSYDGRNFRFNIPGPDVTARELAGWLTHVPAWQLLVLTSSASGAALEPLAHERRTLMTATRSGDQSNVTVFARYLLEGLQNAGADGNKDELVSAQEAFDYASQGVARHYEERRLMATEHPQLENPRPLFVLASLSRPPAEDPATMALVAERDRVAAAIESLKSDKDALGQEAYFAELQQLLLELALIEQRLADGESP